MSAGFALLILVLGSAATSSEASPDLMRITKRSHLAMAMAMSRRGPHEPLRFLVNMFQQKWRKSAKQKKKLENKMRFNGRPVTDLPNYWFKVCTACPKHTWFLRNLEEKEAAAAEAVRTAVIQEAVRKASEGGLTPPPNKK